MVYLEYKGRSATTRMRIVQSLVVSDLVLGYAWVQISLRAEEADESCKDHRVNRDSDELVRGWACGRDDFV